MKRTCPFCSAPLPEEAAFCPRCTHAVNQRTRLRVPRVFPRRLRLGLLLGGAALAAALVLLWRGLPRTYDGQAEVRYADSGGAYQLVLAGTGGGEPVREVRQDAEAGVDYRYPVCLYIRRADSGDDAGKAFLREVDWVRVDFSDSGAGGSVSGTLPAPRPDYVPEAALVSFVDFTAREDFSAQMTWTLRMKNGDTIRLRQDHVVTVLRTHDITPDDAPMGTTAELQALIDRLSGEIPAGEAVNLHLPAAVYDGELVVRDRSFNFLGAPEGEGRTIFTGTLRLEESAGGWISCIQDIDFRGDGDGVALSSAARARAVNCAFTGWRTGFLAYGAAWCNVIGCTFADNQVGFHFNSTGGSASHSMYDHNLFRDNGTGVLLENVPTDIALNFQDSRFEGNGIDIDNRCRHPLDIAGAVFQ